MANILESMFQILKNGLEGDPPPPPILQGIGNRLDELLTVNVDPSGDGIERWLAKLREITNDTRLHETLIVRAVQMHFPRLAEALTLLGIISFEWDGNKPAAFAINWEQFNQLLTKPGESSLRLLLSKVQNLQDLKALQVLSLMLLSAPQPLLSLEYRQQGFGGLPLDNVPGINSDELKELIVRLIHSPLRLPLPFALPLTLAQFIEMATSEAVDPQGSITLDGAANFDQLDDLAFELFLREAETAKSKRINLGNGWQLTFESSDSGLKTYRIQYSANGLDTAVRPAGDLGIFLHKQPTENALLIGELNGTHFAIQSLQFGLRLRAVGPLFDVVCKLERVEFALKPDFLKFLSFGLNLPTLLKFNSTIETSYVQGKGLSGQGSAGGVPALGIEFATPLNLKIGGGGAALNIDQVVTRLEVASKVGGIDVRALFRYGANAQFGPLNAVMEGAGVWIGRWLDGNGGLLPPQGIGLALDAPPVVGGGFLQRISDDEFAGALQLKILGIGAFAYGLYQTLPNGDLSVVLLIGIRLPFPGIQISFGFAISGFGGLVGINRRADTDLLRERLASGTSGDVLFNDNPVANAPKLLGDMRLFFPPQQGVFLVGPTLRINWLLILKLDVGVFIELPGPRKIFIAGSARLVIGSEEFALVYLRMDFVGGIDLTKSLIFFDAMLVNSHVLGVFRVTGGVALRIAYGTNSYFLFTVGGFHPSFNPGLMELPRVARVGVSLSLGVVWLKQEMYLALTANTFQLGARVEAGIEIGAISAHGWFGFDALIQFRPFYFVARIDAGFEVEAFGLSLCGVRVEGQLSGPGPLVLNARATVRILGMKRSRSVTIELNRNPPEQVIAIPDLPQHLKAELSDPDNLLMEGEDPSVIFAAQITKRSDKLKLLAPVGELIWEQKRVPLNRSLQKAEGVPLSGWHTLAIEGKLGAAAPESSSPEYEWFGSGTYLNLADSEALNNTRFVQEQSGLRMGVGAMSAGSKQPATMEIELVKLPKRVRFPLVAIHQYVNADLAGMLAERGSGVQMPAIEAGVTVSQESWNHHAGDGAVQNAAPLNSVQAFVATKQHGGLALPSTEQALDLTGVF